MPNPYLDRLRTVGTLRAGRSRDRVVEGYDEQGCRTRTVIDQLGNRVTEHDNAADQVDVRIKAPQVRLAGMEVRDG